MCWRKTRSSKYLTEQQREARAEELEQSILDYVRNGKGLVVVHGAPTMLNNSPEFGKMVGGTFDYHPVSQQVTATTIDPDHTLVAAFEGKEPFIHTDEPYCFCGTYQEKDFLPLLKMDTASLNDPKGKAAKDIRYISWIKPYGQGRVFYCSPGHTIRRVSRAPRSCVIILTGSSTPRAT